MTVGDVFYKSKEDLNLPHDKMCICTFITDIEIVAVYINSLSTYYNSIQKILRTNYSFLKHDSFLSFHSLLTFSTTGTKIDIIGKLSPDDIEIMINNIKTSRFISSRDKALYT